MMEETKVATTSTSKAVALATLPKWEDIAGDPFEGPADGEVDVWRTLTRVEAIAKAAREALIDEREGDFTRDVLELHTHSALLLHLVASW